MKNKFILFLIFFFLCSYVSVAQENDILGVINASIVRLDLFWTTDKNGSSRMVEESNSLGVLISSEGHVLTCCHSVKLSQKTTSKYGLSSKEIADSINLVFFCEGEKKSFPARVVATDEEKDLAIVQPYEKVNFFKKIKIKSGGPFDKEEIFYASVNPEDPWNNISSGRLAYSVLNDRGRQVMGFSMDIKSGSSGSGLFDEKGNLVGIIYATGTFKNIPCEENMALVIPGKELSLFLKKNNVKY